MIKPFKNFRNKIQDKADVLAEESYKKAESKKKKIKVVDEDIKTNKKNKNEQKTKKVSKKSKRK